MKIPMADRLRLATRNPLIAIVLLAVPFLAINVVTADRSPTVWIDEVYFTDPGVNLAMGRGFRTTASPYQDSHALYATNSPLHPLVVAAWVTFFGFTITSVRSINYVLLVALVVILWDAARRVELITSVRGAVLLSLLLFGGYAITFSYRSGRYDMLGAVLMAALAWTATLPARRWRSAALIALAALLPWTGLQLVPYAVAVALVMLVWVGAGAVRPVLLVGAGIALGGASLAGYLFANGVLDDFVTSVTSMSDATSGVLPRLTAAAAGLRTDASSMLLAVVLVLLTLDDFRQRRKWRWQTPAVAGLLFASIVPLVVGVAGRWMGYYSWMKFVPMSVCAVAALAPSGARRPRWLSTASTLLMLVAASGFLARMSVVAIEWRARDYAQVEAFVGAHLRPDDIAYADFQAYYPARRRAEEVYLPTHRALLGADEKAAITVLVIDPAGLEAVTPALGRGWTAQATFSSPDPLFPAASIARLLARERGTFGGYTLTVYRRPRP
jgi:hypothetical protein